MNTTKLIAQWTMSGARRDVGGRFRATDDIGAVIADNQPTPEPRAAASSFLIKGADVDSWQPREVIAGTESTPEPTAAATSFLIKGASEDSWQPLDV